MQYFYMKRVQYNECLVSIVDTDGLVLWHQGISSHSADYAPKRFPVFKVYLLKAITMRWN